MNIRDNLKSKQRIVVKIGSSSLVHAETGRLNLPKIEILAREIADLHNQGKDVIVVSSGAISVGRATMGIGELRTLKQKQACAAIGQVTLMMIYQKLFSEYGQTIAQVLLTKQTMLNDESLRNSRNTFEELFSLGVIPIVNENDTVETYDIRFGDNDRLSAIVTALVHADLLVLLSDIQGLYTEDPRSNPNAEFISEVKEIDEKLLSMAGNAPGSSFGTGGMATKLAAAEIATAAGADMIIALADDFRILHKLINGEELGTIFHAHPHEFRLREVLENMT
ncbi:MAG: glutamate 5-kinase [Lachnospiraceae bacterium]|nr:glutamate 5-kinase [Lachnospiraceae bacterium]